MAYEMEGVAELEEGMVEGEEGEVRVQVEKPRLVRRKHDQEALTEHNDPADERL